MSSISWVIRKQKKKKDFCSVRRLCACPQKKGVVSKIRVVSPKKPNSARRKVAKLKLSTGKFVLAKLKGQGHNLQSFSNVLVSGGRANDLPAVRFTMIKGALDFNWQETISRKKSRSKYGIPKDLS
jgi:small subunit ribosomal protein S12